MKKVLLSFLLILSCLFIGCKNDKNNVNEANIENKTGKSDIVKKYLDFFDQEDNVIVAVYFKNKEFLSEDEWKGLTVLDPQEKVQESLGNFKNYILVIAKNDIKSCDIRTMTDKEITLFALKKGESFVVKSYEDIDIIITMSGEKEENIIELFGSQGLRLYCTENGEMEFPDYGYIVQSWYEYEGYNETQKNGDISKEVDLDGDGKVEKLSFTADDELVIVEEVEKNHSGEIIIDGEKFSTYDLLKMANMDFQSFPVSNLEVIDIDKNDKYKEIAFRISDENELGEETFILFHYKDGNLKYLGSLEYAYGKLAKAMDSENDLLNIKRNFGLYLGFPYKVSRIYKIKNEKLIFEPKVEEIKFFGQRIVGIVKIPVNIYETTDSNKLLFKAKEGSSLLFLETDHKSWIKVKDFETGVVGYIRFIIEKEDIDFPEFKFFEQEELRSFFNVFINLPELIP